MRGWWMMLRVVKGDPDRTRREWDIRYVASGGAGRTDRSILLYFTLKPSPVPAAALRCHFQAVSRLAPALPSLPSRLPSFARAQYIPSRARASHIPSRARAPHISTSSVRSNRLPTSHSHDDFPVPPFRLGLVLRVELDDHLLGCRTGTLPLARLGRSLRCHRRRRCRLGSRS